MNLTNVGLEELGCTIKACSSCLDSMSEPINVLSNDQNSLWATKEGLPQFVIISLENIAVQFKRISEVGFMVWHDYETNPKEIALWVAQTTDQEFVCWTEFTLEQKKGIQVFQIDPLPENFVFLKFSITETYGAFETYLNQIFLMAEAESETGAIQQSEINQIYPRAIQKQSSNSEDKISISRHKDFGLAELSDNLENLIRIEKKLDKGNKGKQGAFQRANNKKGDQSSSQQNGLVPHASKNSSSNSKKFSVYYHEPHDSPSGSLQNMSGAPSQSDYFHGGSFDENPRKYGQRFSKTKKSQQWQLRKKQENPQTQKLSSNFDSGVSIEKAKQYEYQYQNQSNFQTSNYENCLRTSQKFGAERSERQATDARLSLHIQKLSDNMQEIERKVNILDLKVSHSHQKIEQKVLEKVKDVAEQIIQKKLRKQFSQTNFEYKKNLTQEFFRGETSRKKYRVDIEAEPTQRIRHQNNAFKHQNDKNVQTLLKCSRSSAKEEMRLNSLRGKGEGKAQKTFNHRNIDRLLNQLNLKLKEREVKLAKMHERERSKEAQHKASLKTDRYGRNKKHQQYYRRTAAEEEYGV